MKMHSTALLKTFCKILSSTVILLALNIRSVCVFLFYGGRLDSMLPKSCAVTEIVCYLLLLYINFFPTWTVRKVSTTRNKVLADGIALLQIFLATTVIELICCVTMLIVGLPGYDTEFSNPFFWLRQLGLSFVVEFILFWNGMLRVYLTSVQLGIKWRVIGAVCGLIPFVNLYVLHKILRITRNEVIYENEKYLLNQVRAESLHCQTRYPILLVHGVFFRDFRFFNYWGRIPIELKRNGATLYYGNQQSAASVAHCGEELAARIKQIIQETGCEKVNIIAHSKGGLDSRHAISACGVAPCVASLTTINTPHRGCIFADYLLDNIPDNICAQAASKYNAALTLLGDNKPDFMEAVQDLTASACTSRNELLPDDPQVYYQSVGSKMNHALSGRFPLNMSYPMVKHFDGVCDGLVSIDSMKWGDDFTYLSVPGGRGISHGDMIDLNRENIAGFDVREFYVDLVHKLKERGF